MFWWILVFIILFLLISIFVTAYVSYRIAFYSSYEKRKQSYQSGPPQADIYRLYQDIMKRMIHEVSQIPSREVSIKSYDGLTLRGKFYEYTPGAPIELMIHGYRGNSERDMSIGVLRAFRQGRSALLVDQRGCGHSEGNHICFGIKEHRDCLSWVNFIIKNYGSDSQIILTGISMGAATVLMAAGKPLPPNVIGVIADCGYSTPREIIQKFIKQIKLPVKIIYPFVRIGARLFAGFRVESYSPMMAMETCKIPVFFIHGDNDKFVPCDMSRAMYQACSSRKKLVTVPGAGHGLSYLVDPELYCAALKEFYP